MSPKLAQVITRMIPGGASRIVSRIVTNLNDQFDITLVTGPQDVPNSLESSLPTSVNVTIMPDLRREISLYHDLRALFTLRSHFRRENYDLIHTHTSKAGLLGRFAAFFLDADLVHTPHGLIYEKPAVIPGVPQSAFLRKGLLYLEKLASLNQQAITALSKAEAKQCDKLGLGRPDTIHTVYNGIENVTVNEQSRHATRSELSIDRETLLLVSVGRLSREKGYHRLIDTFAELRKQHDRLELLIAGDGPQRDRLENRVPDSLRNDVHLPGYVDNVDPIYAAGDIYAMSSQYEGFGLSMVEAMNAGLPVVATKTGGIPEIVEDGVHGLLVEPYGDRSLTEALERLISNPDLREELGRNARERSLDFTVDKMVKNYHDLYCDVLKEE